MEKEQIQEEGQTELEILANKLYFNLYAKMCCDEAKIFPDPSIKNTRGPRQESVLARSKKTDEAFRVTHEVTPTESSLFITDIISDVPTGKKQDKNEEKFNRTLLFRRHILVNAIKIRVSDGALVEFPQEERIKFLSTVIDTRFGSVSVTQLRDFTLPHQPNCK
jgi:hypothetical protein